MTTQYIAQDISTEEGFRANAYPDPISGGDPWTVGFGSTGPGIVKGTVWTIEQARADRDRRIMRIEGDLDAQESWWRKLSDPRQDVLVQMAYQMGVAGLQQFHTFLADLRADLASGMDDYSNAATAMGQSKWARQTSGREERLAKQILTGVRQEA